MARTKQPAKKPSPSGDTETWRTAHVQTRPEESPRQSDRPKAAQI